MIEISELPLAAETCSGCQHKKEPVLVNLSVGPSLCRNRCLEHAKKAS